MEHENEYALTARQPRPPLIIEGLKYPDEVQVLIEDFNAKHDTWAEADTELVISLEDLLDAKAKDAEAFRESVLAEAKDPGLVHTPKAARLVERNQILASERLMETNRAASLVAEAIKANAKEIVIAAISMARDGIAENERLILEAGQLVIQASEVREKSLAGLVQVSELTSGTYSFDPAIPKQGNPVMPDIRETRAHDILKSLEKLIADGVLFPTK